MEEIRREARVRGSVEYIAYWLERNSPEPANSKKRLSVPNAGSFYGWAGGGGQYVHSGSNAKLWKVVFELSALSPNQTEVSLTCTDLTPEEAQPYLNLFAKACDTWGSGEDERRVEQTDADLPNVDSEELDLPSRPADLQKWKKVWGLTRTQWERNATPQEIARWIDKVHPDLPSGVDTVRKIMTAGESGQLE